MLKKVSNLKKNTFVTFIFLQLGLVFFLTHVPSACQTKGRGHQHNKSSSSQLLSSADTNSPRGGLQVFPTVRHLLCSLLQDSIAVKLNISQSSSSTCLKCHISLFVLCVMTLLGGLGGSEQTSREKSLHFSLY